MSSSLAELVESVIVDAYGDAEQLTAFLTVFDEEVRTPCSATVLDTTLSVVGFDWEGDERRGLVVRCRRHDGGGVQVVSLADVRFESGTVAAWLHAGYRTWLGLDPFPARQPPGWSWPPL